jgi:ParB-like chromosome segregation protein Spo0J
MSTDSQQQSTKQREQDDSARKVETTVMSVDQLSDSERFQVAPDLSKAKYNQLKRLIRADGITDALYVSTENEIIDGFHRRRIAEELGIETVDVVVFDGTDVELWTKARVSNLAGRDSDDTLKKTFITGQLLHLDQAGVHWTDQRIADELGVSQQWVTRIRGRLADDGEFTTSGNLPTSHKRDIAQELLESDTDYSLTDIADEDRETLEKLAESDRKSAPIYRWYLDRVGVLDASADRSSVGVCDRLDDAPIEFGCETLAVSLAVVDPSHRYERVNDRVDTNVICVRSSTTPGQRASIPPEIGGGSEGVALC